MNKVVDWVIGFFTKIYLLIITGNKDHKNVKFNGFFQNSGSVLIIMPESEEAALEAKSVIEYFLEKELDLTVFVSAGNTITSALEKSISVITYSNKEKNLLRFPGKELIEKLGEKSFDLVLNLNTIPDYYHLSCVKNTNGKWKAGFYCRHADKIFNILVKNNSDEPKISYKNLLNCLTMF